LLTTEEKRSLRPVQGRASSMATNPSGTVAAIWGWYDRRQGVVVWGFRNSDSLQHQVILYRNSYYFGDAFWSIYSANQTFRTSFLDGGRPVPPISDRTILENAPPLALVQFDGFPQTVACFVMTLAPGQQWAMVEGGYSSMTEPSGARLFDVSPLAGGDYCLTYDAQAVKEWGGQARSRLQGYSPDPSTFNTWLFQAESGTPYRRFFRGDDFVYGRCAPVATMVAAPERKQAPPQYDPGILSPPVFPDVLSPPLNP
jgi:hypothetical protein